MSRELSSPESRDESAERIRVLYIAGNGRSGSTLLDRIIGQVPGVVSLGELKWVWALGMRDNLLCECRAPFNSCSFWTSVTQRIGLGAGSSTIEPVVDAISRLDRLHRVPALAIGTASGARFVDEPLLDRVIPRLYEGIQIVAGADLLVDSSKTPAYAIYLASLPQLEVHLVHLVRDPRAVAYSWTRPRVRTEILGGNHRMPVRPAGLTAARWLYTNGIYSSLNTRFASYTRVRYEDLASSPRSTLESLGSHLRMPLADEIWSGENEVALDVGHTVAGNPMRFSSGHVQVKPDMRWQNEMPKFERRLVSIITAPLRPRYGYSGIRKA
jgi:hypothetical protein